MLNNADNYQQTKNNSKNKTNLINDKISIILPELMARNSKLGDRLKNKLKVSNFLNNTENRNKKYLKSFVYYSDKRVKDLKTGLELLKAIKQGSKNLSPLCSQISNDIIIKNSDFLIEEKKLLNENTEQETHLKINDLIHNLKNTVKNYNIHHEKPPKKPIKSLSEIELHNLKYYFNNKIKREKNMLNKKIQGYLDKLNNNTSEEGRKDFKSYIENLNISDNLNLLGYTKPKPLKIKDKESTNMVRIKKQIFPYINSFNKINKKKYINLNNISKHNINLNLNISSDINNLSFNEFGRSEIKQKDTLKVLNNLAVQHRNLQLKISKSVGRVNSLLDINLPTPKAYEQIIKETKKNSSINTNENNNINNNQEKGNLNDINNILKTSEHHSLSKNKLQKIINIFKKEIDMLNIDNFNFDKKKEENIKEKYHLINPIKQHLKRITKYNQNNSDLNNINENNKLISESSLIKNKINKINKNSINNKREKSNLFKTLKNNQSFSNVSNTNYKSCVSNKGKLMKNKSYDNYSFDSNLVSYSNSFRVNEALKKNYKFII